MHATRIGYYLQKGIQWRALLINVLDYIGKASDFSTFVAQVVSDRSFPLIVGYKLARITQAELLAKVGIDLAVEQALQTTEDENNATLYQICFNLPLSCG